MKLESRMVSLLTYVGGSIPEHSEAKKAKFLTWGLDYDDLANGVGNYTVAIVEMPDGTVESWPARLTRFINERKIAKESLASNFTKSFDVLKQTLSQICDDFLQEKVDEFWDYVEIDVSERENIVRYLPIEIPDKFIPEECYRELDCEIISACVDIGRRIQPPLYEGESIFREEIINSLNKYLSRAYLPEELCDRFSIILKRWYSHLLNNFLNQLYSQFDNS